MYFTDGGRPIVFAMLKNGVKADFVLATLMNTNDEGRDTQELGSQAVVNFQTESTPLGCLNSSM